MAGLRTGMVSIAFVNITCPHCHAMQECSYGDAYEVREVVAGETWGCQMCGQSFRIPARVERADLRADTEPAPRATA